MTDEDLKLLWQQSDRKLDDIRAFTRQNREEITRIKLESTIRGMRPTKWAAIALGLAWVVGMDILLCTVLWQAPPFLFVSALIQILITKVAILIYMYHLALIDRIDFAGPIVTTMGRLSKLRSMTMLSTRVLLLQLPVWTTFYITDDMIQHAPWWGWVLQGAVTLSFMVAALWLFFNIRLENKDSRWFRLLFAGKEWQPILRAMELYENTESFQKA